MPRTASHQQPSGILPASGELAAKISSGPAYGHLQLRYKLYHNIAAQDYLSPCYSFASATMKMTIALVASLLTVVAARHVLQSTTARVTFYDNSHYSGGGQAFDAAVPATGCGPCTDLVRSSLYTRLSPPSYSEQQRGPFLSCSHCSESACQHM